MSSLPWFSASAMSQHLVNDQIKRRTNAAVVAFQQQALDDNAPLSSPSISDVNVWQAHEIARGEGQPRAAGAWQALRERVHALAAMRASARSQRKLSLREKHLHQRA